MARYSPTVCRPCRSRRCCHARSPRAPGTSQADRPACSRLRIHRTGPQVLPHRYSHITERRSLHLQYANTPAHAGLSASLSSLSSSLRRALFTSPSRPSLLQQVARPVRPAINTWALRTRQRCPFAVLSISTLTAVLRSAPPRAPMLLQTDTSTQCNFSAQAKT